MNIEDRLSKPIAVKQLDPLVRPMIYLNGGTNPNIIVVEQPKVDKEVATQEAITYNEPPPKELVNKLLSDVYSSSEDIKAWAYNEVIPLMLGFEDARNKLSEELVHIFGDQQISLDIMQRVLSKSLVVKSALFAGEKLGLTQAQIKTVVEVHFNETLERIRSNRSNTNKA